MGDTLFEHSIERTDFPSENWETLNNSLIKIIKVMSGDFILYPVHGNDTTLLQK